MIWIMRLTLKKFAYKIVYIECLEQFAAAKLLVF